MVHPSDRDDATPRNPDMREAILCAAEDLFLTNGFTAVSARDIAHVDELFDDARRPLIEEGH